MIPNKSDMKKILPVLLALAPLLVRAGGDEVVVVYNLQMPKSKVIAVLTSCVESAAKPGGVTGQVGNESKIIS